MALQVGRALGRGARRSVSGSGMVVLVLLVLYQVAFVGGMNTVIAGILPADTQPGDLGVGFTLPVSTGAAVAIGIASLILGVGVFVIAARLLTRDTTALSTVPREAFTRRIGRASLSALAVSLVLSVAIPLGFVLFVIPGLFLAVSFQFAVFAVAVEDAGPLTALGRSWEVASGNRWRLLALVVVFGATGGVAGAIGSVFSLADPLVGQLVSLALYSIVLVLMYGILADAFVQLRDETPPLERGDTPGTTDVTVL